MKIRSFKNQYKEPIGPSPGVFYRAWYTNYDGGRIQITFFEYYLLRETPCGYWINGELYDSKDRWISKNSRKSYAYPTKEQALNSLKCRKNRQVKILEGRLRESKAILYMIEEGMTSYNPSNIRFGLNNECK